MNWGCKHQTNKDKIIFCELLNKECTPGKKGCVLNKKVKFLKLSNGGQTNETRNRKSNI